MNNEKMDMLIDDINNYVEMQVEYATSHTDSLNEYIDACFDGLFDCSKFTLDTEENIEDFMKRQSVSEDELITILRRNIVKCEFIDNIFMSKNISQRLTLDIFLLNELAIQLPYDIMERMRNITNWIHMESNIDCTLIDNIAYSNISGFYQIYTDIEQLENWILEYKANK